MDYKHLLSLVLLLTLSTPALAAEEKFDAFWVKFKAAVQKNDKAAVAEMTKFPYMLQDKNINKAQFIKSYATIFDASARKCLPKQKPVKDKDSYMAFCGEDIFIFTKAGDHYLFTEIGVND